MNLRRPLKTPPPQYTQTATEAHRKSPTVPSLTIQNWLVVNILLILVNIGLLYVIIWLMMVNNNLVGGAIINHLENDGVKVNGKDELSLFFEISKYDISS